MGPSAVGIFLTVRAGGAIAISMLFGAWFDRRPSLWPLLVTLVAGSVGYALLTTTTDFVLLCLIATVPLGMGAAAFPLLFAVAKVQAAEANPLAVARSITLLRASFSLAWGIGPALGAIVVREDNYNALFWVSALCSGLAVAPLMLKWVAAPASVGAAVVGPRLGVAVVLAASSLTLFSMALGMGAVALPIAITSEFAGSKFDVGLAASVCALLEVPVMMAIAARPSYFLGYKGMVLGFVAMTLYFVAAATGALGGGARLGPNPASGRDWFRELHRHQLLAGPHAKSRRGGLGALFEHQPDRPVAGGSGRRGVGAGLRLPFSVLALRRYQRGGLGLPGGRAPKLICALRNDNVTRIARFRFGPPVLQKVDQGAQLGLHAMALREIEFEARQRRTPIGQHPHQPPARLRVDIAVDHVGDAKPVERRRIASGLAASLAGGEGQRTR